MRIKQITLNVFCLKRFKRKCLVSNNDRMNILNFKNKNLNFTFLLYFCLLLLLINATTNLNNILYFRA